ncbi:MAG: DUF432 domain-containing protein [Candidatus Aminicenantes bacterium]|nr:DUF432 domain-containing protein [Candidatus Aminicenantes bacterium]
MFGTHNLPLSLQNEAFSLLIEREGNLYTYKREAGKETKEKVILSDQKKILLNPIEPLNVPKELTPYLYIEFKRTLTMEPKSTRKIFLTFPLEIGVFLYKKKEFEILDIFTLTQPKFTLYGDPSSGVICKYWKSDIFSSLPSLNYYHEGAMELSLMNTSDEWEEVSKAVFNANGMKIYYHNKLVAMKAEMNVENQSTAETNFLDSPLEKEMIKSLELFTTKKLPITSTKFFMRDGI